jgi:hypothetical protein
MAFRQCGSVRRRPSVPPALRPVGRPGRSHPPVASQTGRSTARSGRSNASESSVWLSAPNSRSRRSSGRTAADATPRRALRPKGGTNVPDGGALTGNIGSAAQPVEQALDFGECDRDQAVVGVRTGVFGAVTAARKAWASMARVVQRYRDFQPRTRCWSRPHRPLPASICANPSQPGASSGCTTRHRHQLDHRRISPRHRPVAHPNSGYRLCQRFP